MWWWYINTIIVFLDVIHRPVSETGFYLCLQVEPTQLSPLDRASPYLRRLDSVSAFRWNLLSWAHSTEPVPVSKDRILSPPSGRTYSVGPNRQSQSLSPKTGFCLLLQVEPTPLDPIHRASPCLRRQDSVFAFRWNLLSWAHSTELVPVSGDPHRHKIWVI
jgi:hypothetical protein